jgi:hypothetical protein
MTYAEAILEALGDFGATAFIVGDRLRIKAPPGALPEAAWLDIAANKPALIDALRSRDRALNIVLNLRLGALERLIGAAALADSMREATHLLSDAGATNFDAQCWTAVFLCERHGINPEAPTISDPARTFDAGAAYDPAAAKVEAERLFTARKITLAQRNGLLAFAEQSAGEPNHNESTFEQRRAA